MNKLTMILAALCLGDGTNIIERDTLAIDQKYSAADPEQLIAKTNSVRWHGFLEQKHDGHEIWSVGINTNGITSISVCSSNMFDWIQISSPNTNSFEPSETTIVIHCTNEMSITYSNGGWTRTRFKPGKEYFKDTTLFTNPPITNAIKITSTPYNQHHDPVISNYPASFMDFMDILSRPTRWIHSPVTLDCPDSGRCGMFQQRGNLDVELGLRPDGVCVWRSVTNR